MPVLLLGLALVVFSVASIIDAQRITDRFRKPGVYDLMGPDRYLLTLAILMLLLGLVLAAQGIAHLRTRKGGPSLTGFGLLTHLWLLGVVALYALLMPVLGFTAATLVFFLLAFGVMGGGRWRRAALSAALATAVFALVFVRAADMFLPKGWFGWG